MSSVHPSRTNAFIAATAFVFAALAWLPFTARAAGPAADVAFVQKAAAGGLAEVAAGTLAQKKGNNDRVKQFGAHMVEDHSKANDELKALAAAKKIEVPSTPDAEHRQALAKLEAASGAAFDRAYRAQMVADHQKTIALFEQQAKNGQDADLKAFAAKTLPSLREHLKMAQTL
jgi:putative membrane protein